MTKKSFFPTLPTVIFTACATLTLTHAASPEAAAQASNPMALVSGKISSPETLSKLFSAGGMVMIPLLLLSVITLALVLVYLVTLRNKAVAGQRYMTTAETLLGKGDLMGLLAISHRHGDTVALIFSRVLDFLAANPRATNEQLREIAQAEGGREAALLNQRVAWLADIATIAPMLGLLGTVFGTSDRHSGNGRLCVFPWTSPGNDLGNGGGNGPPDGQAALVPQQGHHRLPRVGKPRP